MLKKPTKKDASNHVHITTNSVYLVIIIAKNMKTQEKIDLAKKQQMKIML